MTAIEGGQRDAGKAERSGPLRLFGVSALVALVTNGLQFWHSSVETRKLVQETQNLQAERDKTVAEVQQLERELAEGASRSIQTWLDQLLKFSQPEDKVMVLSALLSTTPDESIKAWAREQMKRLESQMAARQSEAEEKLALAVREAPATVPLPTLFPPAESPSSAGGTSGAVASNVGSIGQGGATASGAGTGSGSHRGGSAGLAGEPLPAVPRDPRLAAVQLAASNLERVRRARKLLLDAEREPRLLPPAPPSEGPRDVLPPR